MIWDGRIRADARQLPIASESVQCCVTSPPYWGLRDYGNPDQIGLEKTPREYLNNIREVAFEIWRVLRKDGTFWLNLGDSYAGSWGAQSREKPGPQGATTLTGGSTLSARQIVAHPKETHTGSLKNTPGLKAKDLCGIPWRVAFALQEDGWYLRSDIIWHKPNPMPESVTDRPTRAHEYLFLLTKSAKYFYDAAAIAEPCAFPDGPNSPQSIKSPHGQGFTRNSGSFRGSSFTAGKTAAFKNNLGQGERLERDTRNKRSVWTISTQPYPEAHYATFPEEIPELRIKAGSRPGDLIFDPFFGSGTVGKVAERLSRRWIGCDLGYQDLQAQRLKNLQKVFV